MGSPWHLREGFATSSRALHEDVAGAEGFEKASRRLREGFAKASAIPTEASWSLLEGFAKAPRAPSFGNDSSDNDKPPRTLQMGSTKIPEPVRTAKDNFHRQRLVWWLNPESNF